MSKQVDTRKAAMIGCGFVGSASAFALMQSGLFSELVLIDANHDKAEGEAMDIAHGLPFAGQMKIYAGDYDDIVDAAVIIVTAGAAQKPGETRLDLVNKNVNIFKSIIPEIAKRNYKGILLIVANPVDILTYTAVKLSGLPENRVIGSGTVLDTARLKYALGEHLELIPEAFIPLLLESMGTARSLLGAVLTYRESRSMIFANYVDILTMKKQCTGSQTMLRTVRMILSKRRVRRIMVSQCRLNVSVSALCVTKSRSCQFPL